MMEWSHGYESVLSGVLFCYDGFLFTLCPLLLLFVSNNTMMFVWIGLTINVLALIAIAFFYFPESPVFLLDQGRFEDFSYVIERLYIQNKVSEPE